MTKKLSFTQEMSLELIDKAILYFFKCGLYIFCCSLYKLNKCTLTDKGLKSRLNNHIIPWNWLSIIKRLFLLILTRYPNPLALQRVTIRFVLRKTNKLISDLHNILLVTRYEKICVPIKYFKNVFSSQFIFSSYIKSFITYFI